MHGEWVKNGCDWDIVMLGDCDIGRLWWGDLDSEIVIGRDLFDKSQNMKIGSLQGEVLAALEVPPSLLPSHPHDTLTFLGGLGWRGVVGCAAW